MAVTSRRTGAPLSSQQKADLKRNYGITGDQYNELFNLQKGCCYICKRHQKEFKKRLAVDHCHTTKKIRGLLCKDCNTVLGSVREDIEVLQSMIDYIKTNR